MKNIDIENLFDEYLDITTIDDEKYRIEKKKIYINDSSSFYGQKYVIMSEKLNKKNLYILRKIYSLENNRLRYSYDEYANAKLVNTIEKTEDDQEERLLVIENYDNKNDNEIGMIGSIGNIKRIDSDKLDEINENKKQKKNGILRLILKPIEERNKAA